MEITLHVFSGTPDPTWRLYPDDPGHDVLVEAVRWRNATELDSRLGYSGFTVRFEGGMFTNVKIFI